MSYFIFQLLVIILCCKKIANLQESLLYVHLTQVLQTQNEFFGNNKHNYYYKHTIWDGGTINNNINCVKKALVKEPVLYEKLGFKHKFWLGHTFCNTFISASKKSWIDNLTINRLGTYHCKLVLYPEISLLPSGGGLNILGCTPNRSISPNFC